MDGTTEFPFEIVQVLELPPEVEEPKYSLKILVVAFWTFIIIVLLAVVLLASVAKAISVVEPFATLREFQEKEYKVPEALLVEPIKVEVEMLPT